MAKILIHFFLLLVLAGCGFEGEQPAQDPGLQKKAAPPVGDFSCGSTTCDYEGQYCLLTTNKSGKVTYKNCAKISTDKPSCDWAKRDAKEVQMKKSSNCRYEVQCIESDEKIKVTCVLP